MNESLMKISKYIQYNIKLNKPKPHKTKTTQNK